MDIDSIILGDNQFFGVNHMSQERGNRTRERFKDVSQIRQVLHAALDSGVKGVMFSTHPAIYEITDMIKADPVLRAELNIYVNVPYVFKYVSMMNTMGMYGTIEKMLEGKSVLDKAGYMMKSLIQLGTKNYLQVANRLIDVEMNPFRDLNVKAVFLHNALADLALGYSMHKVVKNFHEYIQKKFNVVPAFGTLNYPRFSNFLGEANVNDSLIMTAINKKGFLMNPGKQAVEAAVREGKHTVLAMATLASGSIRPEEAYEYVFSLGHVRHIVVGASSREHLHETVRIIRGYMR